MCTCVYPRFPYVLVDCSKLCQRCHSHQRCMGKHLGGRRCRVPSTGPGTPWRSGLRRSPGGNVSGCSPRTSLLTRASSCRSSHTGITWTTFGWCAGNVEWGWTSGPWGTCWRRSTCASCATGRSWGEAASGRCSSGINVGIRQGAVSSPPAVRQGRRSIVLRRQGEASECVGSHPWQFRRPQGWIWMPGRRVLLVVVWHCWPRSPTTRKVCHQGWKRRHHR